MRVSSVAALRGGSLLGALAIALSTLVLDAEPASAAVSAVTSTTTTEVEAAGTDSPAPLAGVSVTADVGAQVSVNLSTTKGTLTVNKDTGITLSYGYSESGTELAFSGSATQVNSALASLTLATSAAHKGSSATVSITARGVDTYTYSAETEHYYNYVEDPGVSWSQARADALASKYLGQSGYLATVPSSGINNLITSKIPGATNVWLGGRGDLDVGKYGRVWSWVDGPRGGDLFTQCTTTTGACDYVDSGDFYYAWAPRQPDNWTGAATGGEPYIVTNWNSANGEWNDLPDTSSGISGYVVEYGDDVTGSSGWTDIYSDSSTVLLAGTPDAPTSVSASPGEGQATVTFGAPASNSGSAIDSYRVATTPGGVQTTCRVPAKS